MNILFWPKVGSDYAQFWLRYAWPAQELKRHGHGVKIKDPGFLSRWYGDEKHMADDFAWADLIVCFMPNNREGMRLIEFAKRFDKKIVADVDDYSFAVDPTNPAYKQVGMLDVEGENQALWRSGVNFNRVDNIKMQKLFADAIGAVDALTVTTPVLAELYAPYAKEIWALPNSLDMFWCRHWGKQDDGTFRIGWAGGSSHFRDFQIVEKAMVAVKKDYPDVRFIVLGPDVMPKQLFSIVDEMHPTVEYEGYHNKLGSLGLDLAIAPIRESGFNLGKSNIKWVDYSAFGIPSICSGFDGSPYCTPEGIVEDGVDIILAGDWEEKLRWAIENRDAVKQIGINAEQKARDGFDIKNTWILWSNCYDSICGNIVHV